MTFDKTVDLIYVPKVKNEFGYEIDGQEERTTVLAHIKSVMRNEFYKYGNEEFRPTKVIVISLWDYDNQTIVELDNIKYLVLRNYVLSRDYIELTLGIRGDIF